MNPSVASAAVRPTQMLSCVLPVSPNLPAAAAQASGVPPRPSIDRPVSP